VTTSWTASNRRYIVLRLALALTTTGVPDNRLDAHDGEPSQLPRQGRGPGGRLVGQLPLRFEANLGQTDRRVTYLSRGDHYTLFLTPTEAVLALDPVEHTAGGPGASSRGAEQLRAAAPRDVVRMNLLGGSANPTLEGMQPLAGRVNYVKGIGDGQWRQEVPTYGRVRYEGVYPGIDLVYYGNNGALEYDFVVAPDADPSVIRFAFEGATDVGRSDDGALTMATGSGSLHLRAPVLYQDVNGTRKTVTGAYVVEQGGTVGFQIGGYDRRQPLVIDPVLLYSSYLGGTGADGAADIALDAFGNIYVTGYMASADFPVADPSRPGRFGDDYDLFVTKIDPSGTSLIYTAYLGDTRDDQGLGIAVDPAGFAYVTGAYTFPSSGNQQVLVAKFDPMGTMVYATAFGGASPDVGFAIAINTEGFRTSPASREARRTSRRPTAPFSRAGRGSRMHSCPSSTPPGRRSSTRPISAAASTIVTG
jgi:Beta-propeller repeat